MKTENRRAEARPLQNLKNRKLNTTQVWKQVEDRLVPQLRLSSIDRAVYSHLLRHSRLEGKLRVRFSMTWLARGTRLCEGAARPAMRRLIAHGVLRLIECGKAGHVVEVLLPDEICSMSPDPRAASPQLNLPLAFDVHEMDFLKNPARRQAIHARERGRCFYCQRRLGSTARCIDHVVPRVLLGGNSYRNLVSCCVQCNCRKSDRSAGDYLRWLYRERHLTDVELTERLRALNALAAGKLRPLFPSDSKSTPGSGGWGGRLRAKPAELENRN